MRVSWRGPSVEARVTVYASVSLGIAAEFLLEEANRTVPIEEGTLEGSGNTSVSGLRATVSYNSPYAVRQHEELDYRHAAGRRAKWLEDTFLEQEQAVYELLVRHIGPAFS